MNGDSAAFSAEEMFDLVSTPTNSARQLPFTPFPFPVRNENNEPVREALHHEEDEWP